MDLSELQLIQDSFAETVGTSSVIFSSGCEPLTAFSNSTRFCSLIQSTDAGKQRCFQSFQELLEGALESGEPPTSPRLSCCCTPDWPLHN
ncbi:MAG: PocR ligand-binding domain-containing protein [Candidatus Methanogasteraceae archaeon]